MPNTAAQDSILRMALAMAAADPKSAFTRAQRDWVTRRLQDVDAGAQYRPFTLRERAQLRGPLVAYATEHRPSIVPTLIAQFSEEERQWTSPPCACAVRC